MASSVFARLSALRASGHSRPARRRARLSAAVILVGTVPVAVITTAGGTSQAQGSAARAAAPTPACFGAASHDPEQACYNKDLGLRVTPTPDDALIEPNSSCNPVSYKARPFVCSFAVPKSSPFKPNVTVALVGDSHAVHWRAALDPVAQERRWSGLSITRSSCPFSATVPRLADRGLERSCVEWNRQVPKWFKRHKEVSTVVISEHIQVRVKAPKGTSQFEAKVRGYMRKWRALPSTVKRVVVIHDTPRVTSNTPACVDRAVRSRRKPGSACAIPTRFSLARDPAVEAAARLKSSRYMAIDMTKYFCSQRYCVPVIGGVLVFKDVAHITRAFGETLAPYLQRELEALPAFAPTP